MGDRKQNVAKKPGLNTKVFSFISLFLAVLGLCCCAGFSLVVSSSYSLVAARGLLLLQSKWAPVVAPRGLVRGSTLIGTAHPGQAP